MKQVIKQLIVAGFATSLAVLLVACGGSDSESTPASALSPIAAATPEPTATPTPNPVAISATDVIEASVAAMRQVPSLHFEMESQITASVQDASVTIPVKFSGDYRAPDQIKGTISVTVAFITFESQVVVTGDTVYATDPLSGEWAVAEANPLLTLPIDFLASDLAELRDAKVAGEEELEGTRVYRVTGTAPLEGLGDVSARFEVGLWIGVEDSRLRQVSAKGAFDLGQEVTLFEGMTMRQGSVSVTTKFSDYGKEVSIEPPSLTPAPVATPIQEQELGPEAEALRQLALDYWSAFNSYDVDKVLSYLEDGYRAEQESSIRSNIGQMKSFGVKLGISEQSPPQLVDEGRWEMTIRVQDPLSVRTVRVEFVQVGGEWKISAAEAVK